MPEDNNPQSPGNQPRVSVDNAEPSKSVSSQNVIQPTQELVQNIPSQQPQIVQSAVVGDISPPDSNITPLQPQTVSNQAGTSPSGQLQVGMSASQMGWSQSNVNRSWFNLKKLILYCIVVLIVLGGIFAVLVSTNIIALSKFKTIDYVNSKGTHYSLSFYTKHGTKLLNSGNTELVSKVSAEGKFPITLSIDNGDQNGYNRVKNCGNLTKLSEIQNNNLNQKISLCSIPLGNNIPSGVYVAGIMFNNQASIITIGQDLSHTDISSQASAKQSLTKFGIDSYQDDITKIIASIKIQ